jgi:hypothetical protein
VPHLLLPARGRLSHGSWGPLADEARTATPSRGAVESRATSPPVAAARVETPPQIVEAGEASTRGVGATTSSAVIDSTPSVLYLVGLKTWSGTSLKLTWRQEVQKHVACRYLHLRLRAHVATTVD